MAVTSRTALLDPIRRPEAAEAGDGAAVAAWHAGWTAVVGLTALGAVWLGRPLAAAPEALAPARRDRWPASSSPHWRRGWPWAFVASRAV